MGPAAAPALSRRSAPSRSSGSSATICRGRRRQLRRVARVARRRELDSRAASASRSPGLSRRGSTRCCENDLNGPRDGVPVIGGRTDRQLSDRALGLYVQDDWRVIEPADAQPRSSLGLRRRLADRPEPQRELPGDAAGRRGGPVRRHVARRFRPGAAAGSRQRAAAPWRGIRSVRRRPRRGSRRLGASTRTSVTSPRTCSSPAFDAVQVRTRVLRQRSMQASAEGGRVVLPRRRSARDHQLRLTRSAVQPARRVKSCLRCSSSRTPARPISDGRTSLTASHVVSADYVRVDGRDLNMRVPPERACRRRRAMLGSSPRAAQQRAASGRRSARAAAATTASSSLCVVACRAASMPARPIRRDRRRATSARRMTKSSQNLIQDITDPFGPVQRGPSARTDSRHLLRLSAIVHATMGRPRRADLLLSLGAAGAHLRGTRSERRRRTSTIGPRRRTATPAWTTTIARRSRKAAPARR